MGFISNLERGIAKLEELLNNGCAMKKFRSMLKCQGVSRGTIDNLCNFSSFPNDYRGIPATGEEFITVKNRDILPLSQAEYVTFVFARQSGYICDMNAMTLV